MLIWSVFSSQNRVGFEKVPKPIWRKGWDSNPRCRCRHDGFQDRFFKPLGHPSRKIYGSNYSAKRVLPLQISFVVIIVL